MQSLRVYLAVQNLEAGNRGNHTIFEDENGLDEARKAAAALQMPDIGLDGANIKRVFSCPALGEGRGDGLSTKWVMLISIFLRGNFVQFAAYTNTLTLASIGSPTEVPVPCDSKNRVGSMLRSACSYVRRMRFTCASWSGWVIPGVRPS